MLCKVNLTDALYIEKLELFTLIIIKLLLLGRGLHFISVLMMLLTAATPTVIGACGSFL